VFRKTALVVLVMIVFFAPKSALAQAGNMALASFPGGVTLVQAGTQYTTTFGTMNGLGIGTPPTGATVAPLSNGALYFSQYRVTFSNLPGGHTARLTAYVSTNFNHPAAQIVESCPNTATCTSSGGYAAMSSSVTVQTTVIAGLGNTTTTVGIGIFIPDNDGAGAFAGADGAAVVTFSMIDINNGKTLDSATLTFNGTPGQTVQDAVQLTLGTATGGLTVSTASDYSMAFGNVNGLGIGAGAGLTAVPASGGVIYSTPYLLNPVFTDFASTTATITVKLTSNFAHPTLLKLEDATAAAGPFTVLTSSAAQITSAAADRGSITRYLGLFVGRNTAAPFSGTDNATLTFTMTVP
jgi:hypothetical protein